jgi:hypothetical protein
MEKLTLKLGEILQLSHEINGFNNPETGERIYEGFLNQNLSIILKYELTDCGEFLTKERKKIETLRDELIKKHGTEKNGNMVVNMYLEYKDSEGNITRSMNPKYIEFDTEYSKLLEQEKEVEFPEITVQDLKDAGKTKDQYRALFKLIKKEGTN